MSSQPNALINESSLYLKQHAYNPVQWQPWSEKALQLAKKEDKPLFVSIGYSSCHWCHVMEHESFEDENIATFLNEHFISIKVDREERPDIDALYMEAAQLMTGQGGWPLNVFLTPDLKPFYAGTYFPPVSMHGRPSFKTVLQKLWDVWQSNRSEVEHRAVQAWQGITGDLYDHLPPQSVTEKDFAEITQTISNYYEPDFGGYSSAPKFPMAMLLEFNLRQAHLTGDTTLKDQALYTLDRMLVGGIYDQIGGGFHRYSTDREWHVPHFEKMLYDNGLLLSVLSEAYRSTQQEVYSQAIHQTVDWLEREMLIGTTAFGSALDADTEGEEGKFYVWTMEELESILTKEELFTFQQVCPISEQPMWEGKIIFQREKLRVLSEEELRVYDKIRFARELRERPRRDEKLILGWNSMVIKGLAKAFQVTGVERYKILALTVLSYLSDDQSTEGFKRIIGKPLEQNHAFLDDLALYGEALLAGFELSGNTDWLQEATTISNIIRENHYNHDRAAFSYVPTQRSISKLEQRDIFDNAQPSGTGAAVLFLIRLAKITGDHNVRMLCVRCIPPVGSLLKKHSLNVAYMLQAVQEIQSSHREIVLVGDDTTSFLQAGRAHFSPFDVIITTEKKVSMDTSLPILQHRSSTQSGTTAFICSNFVCQEPVETVEQFMQGLKN